MVRTDLLRGKMAEKNMSGVDIAKALNITQKTFYDKMKKGVFSTSEAYTMIHLLNIENAEEIFFASERS